MFHEDFRRKFELLEESWSKKTEKKVEVKKEEVNKEEVKEDAVAPVAAPGAGTSTSNIALVKTKLGQAPCHQRIKEATAEVFGDKNADNMFAGISHMLDVAAEKLYGDEVFVDFFKSLWEKCKAKVDAFQSEVKDINRPDSQVAGNAVGVEAHSHGKFAEEFHHPEKKTFPPEQKEKMQGTGDAEAEKQLKCDQGIEQPVDEILDAKGKKADKKSEKKESVDRRFKA